MPAIWGTETNGIGRAQGAMENYEPILVNKMYKAKLTAEGETIPGGRIELETVLPQQFEIQLTAGWDRPFKSTSLTGIAGQVLPGAAGKALAGQNGEAMASMNGITTLSKWNSSAVWNGASSISITIPFQFVAELDPQAEVVDKVVQLMQLTAPATGPGGVYFPPGPHTTTAGWFDGQVVGEKIWLRIGTFLEFFPVYITTVSTTFDTQFYAGGDGGKEGLPLYAICNVTVETFWDVEKQDIAKFFSGVEGGVGQTAG